MVLHHNDKEIRKFKSHSILIKTRDVITILETVCSTWIKMKRVIARIFAWRRKRPIEVEDLGSAARALFRLIQQKAYSEEVHPGEQTSKKRSSLFKLWPFLDKNGVLRVGGRIREADLPFMLKHLIILSRRCVTTNLIVDHFHRVLNHAGRNSTLNEIRSNGFWIVNGNSLVNLLYQNVLSAEFYVVRLLYNG